MYTRVMVKVRCTKVKVNVLTHKICEFEIFPVESPVGLCKILSNLLEWHL